MNESKETRISKLEQHRTIQGKDYCGCRCHEKTLGDFMEITDEYAERVWEIFESFGSFQLADGSYKTYMDDALERIANRPKCTCSCKH